MTTKTITLPCTPGRIEKAEYTADADHPMTEFLGYRQGICEGCQGFKYNPRAKDTRKLVNANAAKTRIRTCTEVPN